MDKLFEGWRKFLTEAKAIKKFDKIEVYKDAGDHYFLFSDDSKKHIKEQHKSLGAGSVFSPNVDIEKLVDALSKEKLSSTKVPPFYQVKSSGAGFRLVISKEEKEKLEKKLKSEGIDFTEDTTQKPEGNNKIDVKRLKVSTDLTDPVLKDFETDLIDLLAPVTDLNKIFGTPEEVDATKKTLNDIINSSEEMKKAFEEKRIHTFVTGFPTKENFTVPKASEWGDKFYILYPVGKSSKDSKKDVKESKSKLRNIIKERLAKNNF